jgi:OCT family organic cation transporter-like MFS transporter 4/5
MKFLNSMQIFYIVIIPGMEMMGPSKRLFAGIVIEYFFALGQLVLVAIAFINNVLLKNDWRAMAIFLVLPCIPFLSYFL